MIRQSINVTVFGTLSTFPVTSACSVSDNRHSVVCLYWCRLIFWWFGSSDGDF
jgi:hypothetical protein